MGNNLALIHQTPLDVVVINIGHSKDNLTIQDAIRHRTNL